MGLLQDIETTMTNPWDIPITKDLLNDVLDFHYYTQARGIGLVMYIHRIHISKPEWLELGEGNGVYEWVKLTHNFFDNTFKIHINNEVNWTRMSINKSLGYPKQVTTVQDIITELNNIYKFISNDKCGLSVINKIKL